jgi:oligopeptide transport system substrate-binding protein
LRGAARRNDPPDRGGRLVMGVIRPIVAAAALVVPLALSPPAAAADMNKTLRVAFNAAETGFDPQAMSDLYSAYVARVVFDPLYRYDYLARPFRIVPNTAAAMPAISADGKTWTIKVRPGIFFAEDPAFKGKKRELTAADYVYSWKRLLDPKIRAPNIEAMTDRFVGDETVLAAAKAAGKLDYDMPFEGVRALDRYTIQLKLKQPDYDLLDDLASTVMAAVAREVVATYGDAGNRVMANPVGTGPYLLKEWRRGQKIVLEASPSFRDEIFPDSSDPADQAILAAMKGRKVPAIGRIEISIIEESNPRLLAFQKRELDIATPVPPDLIGNVLDPGNRLKPALAAQGITLVRGIQPAITYEYFNMDDPVVGGYTKEKIALRRAIGMAYNTEDEIGIVRQGQALPATQIIAPNLIGHDPTFDGHAKFDLPAAKALLDRFGYVDRDADGWRDLPDGKPFTLRIASIPSAFDRQLEELWKKSMTGLGIRTDFIKQKFPDLLKQARAGQLQMWGLANTAGSPPGFGVMGLLYGPNAGLSNLARFNLPEFNELYQKGKRLPDGPERNRLIRQMSELVSVYAPWKLQAYRIENVLVQPWVVGYKHSPFNPHPWSYWDIDLARRAAAR